MRIPARQIETLVARRMAQAFDDPIRLIATVQLAVAAARIGEVARACAQVADRLRDRDRSLITGLVAQVASYVWASERSRSIARISPVLTARWISRFSVASRTLIFCFRPFSVTSSFAFSAASMTAL